MPPTSDSTGQQDRITSSAAIRPLSRCLDCDAAIMSGAAEKPCPVSGGAHRWDHGRPATAAPVAFTDVVDICSCDECVDENDDLYDGAASMTPPENAALYCPDCGARKVPYWCRARRVLGALLPTWRVDNRGTIKGSRRANAPTPIRPPVKEANGHG